MRFCQSHWDKLKEAIEKRGLSSLIAESGEQAVANLEREINEGTSIDSFDPLMGAHNAIWANAMEIASKRYGANPMVMMAKEPEHPEWECPICFLNWLYVDHITNCTQPGCDFPKVETYDWMIDKAADEQVEAWKEMRA